MLIEFFKNYLKRYKKDDLKSVYKVALGSYFALNFIIIYLYEFSSLK